MTTLTSTANDPLVLALPELSLSGRFTCTAAPVQAEGLLAGKAFYFRARHGVWTFAVASGSQPDPALVGDPSEGFFLSGVVSPPTTRTRAPGVAAATDLIRACATAFLGQPATYPQVQPDSPRSPVNLHVSLRKQCCCSCVSSPGYHRHRPRCRRTQRRPRRAGSCVRRSLKGRHTEAQHVGPNSSIRAGGLSPKAA